MPDDDPLPEPPVDSARWRRLDAALVRAATGPGLQDRIEGAGQVAAALRLILADHERRLATLEQR